MALSPFSLDLEVVPFFFKFRDSIFGHGFVATVDTMGRAMCETEDGEIVVAGVEPGGLAASGANIDAALAAFRQTFRAVLMDIAAEAPDFDTFHAEVKEFVHQTSPATVAHWDAAVEIARARANELADVARINGDTPASVAVSYSTDLVPGQNVLDDPAQLIAA